jgi:hypothetical protein
MEDAIDYKALLRKYMRHVLDTEGVTFVDYLDIDDSDFTPVEVAALQNMDEEIDDE